MSDQPNRQDASIDALVEAARNGQVARRDFLRRVVLLGLSSSAAYQLLDQTSAAAQSPSSGGQPRLTTFALGEEGNPPAEKPSLNPPTVSPGGKQLTNAVGEEGRPTTMAVGEENKGQPTTMAIGEEGNATTMALGEEGNPPPTTYPSGEEQPNCPTPPTRPTTQAFGEEGSPPPTTTTRTFGEESTPRPTTQAVGEEQNATTRAYGEESKPRPNPTTKSVGEESSRWPTQSPVQPTPTTMALGEEGSQRNSGSSRSGNLLRNLPRPWKNFRRW